MTEREELKKLQMKILLEIRRICNKHNIQYFLDAGTMLGAVRHKGYIPWDDDIDVGMIKSEYETFLKVAQKELKDEFFIHNQYTDPEYGLVFTKIRLKGTKFIENKGNPNSQHQEIFVDIFPYYFISDDEYIRRIEAFRMKMLAQMLLIKSGIYVWRGEKMLKAAKFLPFRILCLLYSKKQLYSKINDLYNKHKNTKRICMQDGVNYNRLYFDKQILSVLTDTVFEGEIFKIPKEYDLFLHTAYGDYMTLPPETERITHQILLLDVGKYEMD